MQNRIYRELLRKVRQHGLKRLLVVLPQAAFWELKHYCRSRGAAREGRQFDQFFHLETTKWVQAGSLDVPSELLTRVKRYEPTPVSLLRSMLQSLPIEHSEFVFIDIGAGKGRALMVAGEFHFQKLIGIEISQQLSEIAQRNLAAFQAHFADNLPVEWVTGDARGYVFPPRPLVVYLYNPFDGSVLDVVVRNVEKVINEHRREVFVIYYNPVFRNSFEACPSFAVYRDVRESNYVIFRSLASSVDRPFTPPPEVPADNQEADRYHPQPV